MSTSLNVIVYGNENIFTVKIIDIGIDLIVPDTALFSDADVILLSHSSASTISDTPMGYFHDFGIPMRAWYSSKVSPFA